MTLFNHDSSNSDFINWIRLLKNLENIREVTLLSKQFKVKSNEFFLTPVSALDLKCRSSIEFLAEWRNNHLYAFPSKSNVTLESTELWLNNLIKKNETKILFWVTDIAGQKLGHIGLELGTKNILRIDNVIKSSNIKGLMSVSLKVLEELAINETFVEGFSLFVIPENLHAINFYKKNNYENVNSEDLDSTFPKNPLIVENTEAKQRGCHLYFKNLKSQNLKEFPILTSGPSIGSLEVLNVDNAVRFGWHSMNSNYIKEFEKEFAEYLGVKYALATSSCTAALHLAMLALEIGPGDEVIIPNITWVATAAAVAYTGATPVFCDIDENHWNLNVEHLQTLVNSKTKAVVPVHLYGFPSRMNEIRDLLNPLGIKLIEDAAAAVGATVSGKPVGTFGDFGCFSFQGAKMLVTGEGGMLVTNNDLLYEKAVKLQEHGRKKGTFHIDHLGYKYKMNNLTAALGLAQLHRINHQILKKKQINEWYGEFFNPYHNLGMQIKYDNSQSIFWMNSIFISDLAENKLDQLQVKLTEKGIDTRKLFPGLNTFSFWNTPKIPTPISDFISNRSLNLPSGVALNYQTVKYISQTLVEILGSNF